MNRITLLGIAFFLMSILVGCLWYEIKRVARKHSLGGYSLQDLQRRIARIFIIELLGGILITIFTVAMLPANVTSDGVIPATQPSVERVVFFK